MFRNRMKHTVLFLLLKRVTIMIYHLSTIPQVADLVADTSAIDIFGGYSVGV